MVYEERKMTATRHHRRVILVLVLALALATTTLVALAATPLGVAGYLDFSYEGANDIEEATANAAESKLWWHDGYWWGSLFSPSANAYTIHRLNWTTQNWNDTGVVIDERVSDASGRATRADVLWDGTTLYIASHKKLENPAYNTEDINRARLMRYTYDDAADTWTPVGAPVIINNDVTKSLVLDKDNTGRLWITYVSRQQSSSTYQVYVNASEPGDPTSWGVPFVLPFPEATVISQDISALVAFGDGAQIGLMWSNQLDNKFYLALRNAGGDDPAAGWTLDAAFTGAIPYPADDHMNMKAAPGGVMLAVIKTGTTVDTEPLIAVVKRASSGTYSLHTVSTYMTRDTRPTMLVDTTTNLVHVFTVSGTRGGYICMESAPLDTLAFAPIDDNCPAPPAQPASDEPLSALGMADAEVFIGDDDTYLFINNPTTTKQMVNAQTGIAVLAADEGDPDLPPPPYQVYVHNVVGGERPEAEFVLNLPVVRQ
jgi:hypothetical protein